MPANAERTALAPASCTSRSTSCVWVNTYCRMSRMRYCASSRTSTIEPSAVSSCTPLKPECWGAATSPIATEPLSAKVSSSWDSTGYGKIQCKPASAIRWNLPRRKTAARWLGCNTNTPLINQAAKTDSSTKAVARQATPLGPEERPEAPPCPDQGPLPCLPFLPNQPLNCCSCYRLYPSCMG